MKIKKAIGGVLLLALVADLAYWVGYQRGSHSPLATHSVPSRLAQAGLAHKDRTPTSELSPVPTTAPPITTESALPYFALLARANMLEDIARTSAPVSPKQGIEDAERHNLYEMQKYQRRVLRDTQAQPSSLPTTITPLNVMEDRR